MEERQQRTVERKASVYLIVEGRAENSQDAEAEKRIDRMKTPEVKNPSPEQSNEEKHRCMYVEMNTQGNIEEDNRVRMIQWNYNGLQSKKEELLALINEVNPRIIAVQGTRITPNAKINIPHYNLWNTQGHYNRRALLLHEEIPVNLVNLRTELQAAAVKIYINRPLTICSIHNSNTHKLAENILDDLIRQLPQPILIMGDFNAYSVNWGNEKQNLGENFLKR